MGWRRLEWAEDEAGTLGLQGGAEGGGFTLDLGFVAGFAELNTPLIDCRLADGIVHLIGHCKDDCAADKVGINADPA